MINRIQIFSKFFTIYLFMLFVFMACSNSLHAQMQYIQQMFKDFDLQLDLEKIANSGYTEVSIWKQKSIGQEYDESGQIWSNTQYQYQYATCFFEEKKIAKITLYDEGSNIIKRFDFYYLDNLLSAIDEVCLDEKHKDIVLCTHIFFYEKSGLPFQKVRTFAKEQNFREITAFSYNSNKQLIQTKVSYIGHPKHAQTLVNLGNGLQLVSYEYIGEKTIINTFKNYNTLINSQQYNSKEELHIYGLNNILERKSLLIYENDLLTKMKTHIYNLQLEATELAVNTDPVLPMELQYFYYNDDALLQAHITEIFNEQIVFSYNYQKEEIINMEE